MAPWLALLLLACGNDIGITQSAQCDGRLQPGEDEVDDVFDRDGDGYFDGSNPGCRETYDEADLDCNDTDPDVNPGAVEVTCNGIDDDCNPDTSDLDSRDCAESFDGTWSLDQRIIYSCAFGNVNIDVVQLVIQDETPAITVTSIGAGSQPGTMTGTLSGAALSVSRVIPGGCTETYALEGTFAGGDAFAGTFTSSYAGGSLNCLECTGNSWPLSATRD